MQSPDSEDLTSYFRQLAEHDLLTPEKERELSELILDLEERTWLLILIRPELVRPTLELITPHLEEPLELPRLLKLVDEMLKPGRRDEKTAKKYLNAATKAAAKLRGIDLDRVHIDAVVKTLSAEPKWWDTKAHKVSLAEIKDHHRGSAQIRNEFIQANLRLVVTMARRYDRGGMPLADLIQEGNLGLMHAVSRFDPKRGLRFSTYACWWIRHAIGRALADKGRAVRIPVHMLEAQQALEKKRQGLQGDLGRPPTAEELALEAEVPLAKLNLMHRYIMGQPMSLDRPTHDDDDRTFGDTIADPMSEESTEDEMTRLALASQIERLLHHLSPIEADVLKQRFGLGDDEEKTFREIGDQYHLSRERIRQIQNLALDKLKRALEREHRGAVDL